MGDVYSNNYDNPTNTLPLFLLSPILSPFSYPIPYSPPILLSPMIQSYDSTPGTQPYSPHRGEIRLGLNTWVNLPGVILGFIYSPRIQSNTTPTPCDPTPVKLGGVYTHTQDSTHILITWVFSQVKKQQPLIQHLGKINPS